METNARMVAKATCWQTSGLVVMTVIGYLFTGSVSQGGSLAFVTTAIGLVAYFIHEKIWSRISWGCRPAVDRVIETDRFGAR